MKNDIVFNHLSPDGSAIMVNTSGKAITGRCAEAEAWIQVGDKIIKKLRQNGGLSKGNVIETARIAGIMAAKRTPEYIPMCHHLVLDCVEIKIELFDTAVRIETRVYCEGKTGVEMEAMTAAAVSALTVYDMVKSAGKDIQIGPIRLMKKTGGKSGPWNRDGGEDVTD